MNYKDEYLKWKNMNIEDSSIEKELLEIEGSDDSIKERFIKNLDFGTGGLRGIMGAGTNRINIYTVRKAAQGFCNYILKSFKSPSVAISYDSRTKSFLFAKECARVMVKNGVKVYLTDTLMPTPFLSFAVRKFNCCGGIMITASHNPYMYNGVKVYDENGCQLTDVPSKLVIDEVNKLDIFNGVDIEDYETALEDGRIKIISKSVYEEYEKVVLEQDMLKGKEFDNLNIVYTPLNGAGSKPVLNILKKMGFKNVKIVKEQEQPDPLFTTCPYPNPEEKAALFLAIFLAKQENADLILATDPDSDRLGVCINVDGEYRILTGNEIGILLVDYIINLKKLNGSMPKNPVVIKTLVSSMLVNKICSKNQIECIDVLTGFKYIGNQIKKLELSNRESDFIFGYEESYGYLTDSFVRDKDAVLSSMHFVKMMSFYKSKGVSILQKLDEIYKTYGYALNVQKSYQLEGIDGQTKINNIVNYIRGNYQGIFKGLKILKVNDYLNSESKNEETKQKTKINLPSSNVLEIVFEGNVNLIVRPSGTEPKIKFYFGAYKELQEDNMNVVKILENFVEKLMCR